MRCTRCGAETDSPRCPKCGQSMNNGAGKPLEPEILTDEQYNQRHISNMTERQYNANYSSGPHWQSVVWQTSGPGTMAPSCLPTFVTIALALLAGFQYGLLASIGFFFFAMIGKGLTFYLTLKRLLEGRLTNPWISHVIIWLVCWILVAWLSGAWDAPQPVAI